MRKNWPGLIVVILLLSLSACGETGGEFDIDIAQSVAATQTKMAWEASVEAARQTEAAEDTAMEEPAPTPEPEVVHQMVPEAEHKELANTYLTDFNSIDFAEEGITYGDQFFINRYERPFTLEMTEYRGYLDLIRADMFVTPPWIYVDIFLADSMPETSGALYALELDLDIDGRGDYLIQFPAPGAAEWSVERVTVLEDSNEDVGGDNPLLTEQLTEDLLGDGYDRVVFEGGVGEDPDLAWVRRSSEDPTMLQIAFKSALTGNTGFLWSVWADEGLRDPAQAEYNDRYTFEEAGSPYPEHQFYPIQEISLLDSTCRSWYGFEPQGNELGICQVYTPGSGFKVCYSYATGPTVLTRCDSICQEECPRGIPYSVGGFSVTCQKCTMPE